MFCLNIKNQINGRSLVWEQKHRQCHSQHRAHWQN